MNESSSAFSCPSTPANARPANALRRAAGPQLRLQRGLLAAVLVAGSVLSPGCGGDEVDEWRLDETGQPRGEVLFDMGEVQDFQLTDQQGRPFGREQMRGRIWIVNFIFTNCPSFCPKLSADMRSVAHRYRDEARVGFLSISVQPEVDTPEVLRNYAANYAADPDRWYFLTGDRPAIVDLIRHSFNEHVGEQMADGDIAHSDRFHVVDEAGHVRWMPSKFLEEKMGDVFLEEVSHGVDLLLAGKGGPLRTDGATRPGRAVEEAPAPGAEGGP